MEERKILFEAENIKKSFGNTHALKGVSMKLYEGEIVGLIGENGAGKSTLLKIIQGVQPQSEGEMRIGGQPFVPHNPMDSNRQGVGMVFQEQSLIVNLTVGQNIFFAREKEFSRCGLINWNKLYAQAAKVLGRMGLEHINPRTRVFEYGFADRQMIEIAKVINNCLHAENHKAIVLLDEPTSVLNEEESQHLFREVRRLKEQGHVVVFISHRLDEVMELTERIYVLKDGQNAGEFRTAEVDSARLYEAMVGRQTNNEYYHLDAQTRYDEHAEVLRVENLGKFGSFQDISFALHKGEILGICGVEGSGKEIVCECITGDTAATEGKIFINGQMQHLRSPAMAKKKGVLSVPKWRNVEGIFGILSIAENICASNFNNIRSRLLLSTRKRDALADEWIEKLRIKCGGKRDMVMSLSGGNVQKVVFARVLQSGATILILDHPTRGVDIGAKEDIYALIRSVTESGCAVILLSDTLEECIGLASSILVMKDGYATKTFAAPVEAKPTQNDIVRYML